MAYRTPFIIFRKWPLHLSINEGRGPIAFCVTFEVAHALCFIYLYIKIGSREYRVEKFIVSTSKQCPHEPREYDKEL